jgi:hypothetical protein
MSQRDRVCNVWERERSTPTHTLTPPHPPTPTHTHPPTHTHTNSYDAHEDQSAIVVTSFVKGVQEQAMESAFPQSASGCRARCPTRACARRLAGEIMGRHMAEGEIRGLIKAQVVWGKALPCWRECGKSKRRLCLCLVRFAQR